MIRLTRSLVRRSLDALLHVHDTPERTAAAFSIGVWLGFSPLLGLHTILAVVVAFVFGFNRVAVLLGVYSNLPWFIAGYYAGTTWLGAILTRTRLPANFRERLSDLINNIDAWRQSGSLSTAMSSVNVFWDELLALLRPLLVPFIVGSLIGCSILAGIAYPLALAFVRRRRKHHEQTHAPETPP